MCVSSLRSVLKCVCLTCALTVKMYVSNLYLSLYVCGVYIGGGERDHPVRRLRHPRDRGTPTQPSTLVHTYINMR